jgi:deoxyribodipyrimidine photo-lyase
VVEHVGHLLERRSGEESPSSPRFRGGQQAADQALASVAKGRLENYADRCDDAYPQRRRTVSQLSPWIRHGLLSLATVWNAVDGDEADLGPFRRALLHQEYARHWYARLGGATAVVGPTLPADPAPAGDRGRCGGLAPPRWDRRMGCVELTLDELEEDGWLVGSTRRWLASQWTVRHGHAWSGGEDYFFRHLLDGSRAANRLGWLEVSGGGSEPSTGFSRWQVEERAPGLCATCELVTDCPIEHWPPQHEPRAFEHHPLLDHDPDVVGTAGPVEPVVTGQPEAVWLTGESLGDADPALSAHPELPAVFVFDEPLLARLRLSSKRLVFITECLSELATRRPVEILRGDPVDLLAGRPLAGTFTPVPGWHRRSARLELVALHPWPWLCRPHHSRIGSFVAWQAGL